eukprot:TRINITY_DN4414_c0_g1_i2.p1 TRINITY_DN4414_c0_g1~~TRINITY_DN4414_c0_g1_i2.p1  ORF type:complete len:257 (-),score=21.41 TRINITY_DN4414_c0_g1_i2:131-901(-)
MGQQDERGTVLAPVTWSTIVGRLQRTHIWVLAIIGTLLVGFVILGSMAIAHVSIYWRKDEANYFNPRYREGNNLTHVVVHATFGILLFLCGPLYLGVHLSDRWNSPTKAFAAKVLGFLYLVLELATVISVAPLGGIAILKAKAGEGVVAIALIWAAMMAITGIIALVFAVRSWITANEGEKLRLSHKYTNWLVRNIALTAYGSLLLPILAALYDDTAADVVLLLVLLILMIGVAEALVRGGINPRTEDQPLHHGDV